MMIQPAITMGSHRITDDQGRCAGILTVADIYQFEGYTFEVHSYCGPCKLKKDLTEAARTGRRFWQAFDRWQALSSEEKAATQISG